MNRISLLVLPALLFSSALCLQPLLANQQNIYTLSGMRIGEELKAFKKRFPESHCHRRQSGALEKAELRRDWLEWVDCGLDRSVLGPDDVLGASRIGGGKAQVYVTFFHKRLVSVEYLLMDIPYDRVLSAYIEKYGIPQTRAEDGLGAVWSRPYCRLAMEEVTLSATLDSLGRLCIEKVPRAKAVCLRLTSRLSETELPKDTETNLTGN